MSQLFLGIDVGTGSARAGVFTADGRMLGLASHTIRTWKPQPDFVEQSSEDIWAACCHAVREAMSNAGVEKRRIAGIGFDATCSLVLLDGQDRPVSASPTGNPDRNVIVWMDHRAIFEAQKINSTRHPVLRYVGGVISPEMQSPKLLWLKSHLPNSWKRTRRFFDLSDFLTYRATGDDTRSLCTTVCKWTYRGHRGLDGRGWDSDYFQTIGLGDLAKEKFRRIGGRIRPMGEALGSGLTAEAADELGLPAGVPVAVSIIDAHAGGLGLLGMPVQGRKVSSRLLEKRVALIGGTSSCHMAVSREPRFIKGIWGPYFSSMIPGLWLTEGGQSATGALIDHVIHSHSASIGLLGEAKKSGTTIYELLNQRLAHLAEQEKTGEIGTLTRDLHIQPDFHGNRSPRANPNLRGGVSGLTLSATEDDLAKLYLATIQGIAYGTRHIIEEMNRKGYSITSITVCGGGTKNPVFLREHADITGCRLVLPKEPEAVLLGSAILGAVAGNRYASVIEAMNAMCGTGLIIEPSPGKLTKFHEAKYRVFHRMHKDHVKYGEFMSAV